MTVLVDLDARFNREGGSRTDSDIAGQMDRAVAHGPGQVRFDGSAEIEGSRRCRDEKKNRTDADQDYR